MRIRGWHIEGYGVFEDCRAVDLSPGLNIVLGPNEAGKTTLLEFLREMLFGIELSRNKPKRYPARPGLRHGGRLFVETEDGTAVIERYGEKGSGVRISLGDGRVVDADALNRWLRGAGKDLFRNVFAIGLAELASFDLLTQAEVRDRIFSAGIAGAGRSARQVVQEFENRAAELLRPRSGGRVNSLLDELAAKNKALEDAREKIRRYPDLRRAETEARERMDALAAECDQFRSRQRRAEDLLALWPEWVKRTAAVREKEELARQRIRPEIETEIEAALLGAPLYAQRCAGLAADRNDWETAGRELEEALKRMGPGWDEARVRSFDLFFARREKVRQFQESIREAREKRINASVALERAREEARKAQTERDLAEQRRNEHPCPDPVLVEQAGKALRRARAALQNASALEMQWRAAADRLASAREPRRSRIPAVMFACAACAAAAAFWLAFAGAGVPAAGMGALAVLLAMFSYLIRRELQPEETVDREALRREEEELRARLESERRDLEQAAAILGLPAACTPADLEEKDAALAADREALRESRRLAEAAQDAAARLKSRQDELAAAEKALAAAGAHERDVLERWQEFSGTGDSPESYLQLIREAERAQELLDRREELAAKIRTAEQQTAEWESNARRLAGDGDPVARLTGIREQIRRLKELDKVIQAADSAIAARLGGAAGSQSLLSELAGGDVDSWKRQRDEALNLLAEKIKLRDAAVREEAEARRLREALEKNADVPKLEMELAALGVELDACVRAWRIATLAKALCEATLERVRRERQPAVIAEASRLFQSITSGRYTRILSDEGSGTLTLEMSNGATRPLEQLSRGTAEQLYLCLRLAFAREFSRNHCNLPLVMDDVLVNFDPQRARLTARVLAEFAQESQVLLFTCHPETAALFASEAPEHRRIELPAPATASFTAP